MTTEKEFDLINCELDGRNLIEASAGTGKTYAISRIFVRLLLEKRYPVGKILAVTFTEAATEELKNRIRCILHESKLAIESGAAMEPLLEALLLRCEKNAALDLINAALRDFDTAAIHTIHGFCQVMLREHAFECGQTFDSQLITDQSALFEEIADDFWRKHFPSASPLFVAYALHKKITPATLLHPLRQFVGQPQLMVLPVIRPAHTQSLIEAFESALENCCGLWLAAKRDIVASLDTSKLDGRKYKPAICAALFADFDAFTRSRFPGPQLFDNFAKCTATVIAAATKKGMAPVEHDFFRRCEVLNEAAEALCRAFDGQFLELKSAFLAFASTELSARKEKQNTLYFDDLLSRVSTALAGAGGGADLAAAIRARYQAALIDEFQDTDPQQYAIFNALFPKGSVLFLIGDPKQAIYSFRGADIFAYLKASVSVERRYTLSVNHRSHPRLIKAYNALFGNRSDAFVYDAIRFRPVSQPSEYVGGNAAHASENGALRLWILRRLSGPSTTQPIAAGAARALIAEAVAAEIARLLCQDAHPAHRILPSHIAVLTRTNREAHIIQEALIAKRIPAVIENADTVYTQPQAIDLYRLLIALQDPSRMDACTVALATLFFGLNATAIASALASDAGARQWISALYEYHDLWHSGGFMRMFQALMSGQSVRSRLLTHPGGDRALTNILHLAELIHAEESLRRLSPGLVCAWLAKKIASPEASGSDEEILRLESDESAVRVMTIHKSKGLEFPIVFCPFSWSGSEISLKEKNGPLFFHDAQRDNIPTLALSAEECLRGGPTATRERLAENIRLLYVALTRAKLRCYCVWGMIASSDTSSLAFLLHGGSPVAQSLQELSAYCKGLSDDRLVEDLSPLVRRSDNSIVISNVDTADAPTLRLAEAPLAELTGLSFKTAVPQPWTVASFSSLTRISVNRAAEERLARWAEGTEYPHLPQSRGGAAGADLHAFPRGSRAGLFFHDVLERLDFANVGSRQTQADIDALLIEYGYPSAWQQPLLRMAADLAQTQLPGATEPFSLAAVSPAQCIREVEFHFPLKPIEPAQLQPFIRACEAGVPGGHAESNGRLEFSPVHGYMKGYMDCIAQHQGRYYLIDWKSNHLGDSFDDYADQKLESIMTQQDYTLQYLIYLTALDALLTLRLPGYRYEDHIGGAAYIFLRGISATRQTGSGVFFRKPSADVVRGLSKTLIGHR